MDHKDAVRQHAAERYVLGELTGAQREEYEEHYFDCAECAVDVRTAVAFVDAGREVLRTEAAEATTEKAAKTAGRWFLWLRPAFAVPALAVLLLFVAYQNTVTIPRAKETAAQAAGQLFTSSFSLQMANTRGDEEVKVQVRPNESFALKFDFTPKRAFDSYVGQLQDETGRSLLQVSVPGTSANKEAQLVVPAVRVRPGKYSLVFTGAPDSSKRGTGDEVLRLRFTVEFWE